MTRKERLNAIQRVKASRDDFQRAIVREAKSMMQAATNGTVIEMSQDGEFRHGCPDIITTTFKYYRKAT